MAELKQNLSKLEKGSSHSDDNVNLRDDDDDGDDIIDSSVCEDLSTDMLTALEYENVHHIYSKKLQEIDNYQDYNLLKPSYNDWFVNSEVENELEDEEAEDLSFEFLFLFRDFE